MNIKPLSISTILLSGLVSFSTIATTEVAVTVDDTATQETKFNAYLETLKQEAKEKALPTRPFKLRLKMWF